MGCCQMSKVENKEKDEPLLKEHLSSAVKTIESVEIKNDKLIDNNNNNNNNKTITYKVENIKQSQVNEKKDSEINTVPDTAPDIVIEETKENKMYNDNAPDIEMDDNKMDEIAEIKFINISNKRKRNLKRDSKIDIKDLKKFEVFTQKMDQKKLGVIIDLKIKSMESRFPLITIQIDQNKSVLDLKNKIYEQSPDKIATVRQRLIHKGRLLKDMRSLKQYNISNEHTIMLVRSRRNQSKKHKNNKSSNKNKKDKKKRDYRSRAMTLNVDTPVYQRSKTPNPGQI
eukprot:530610_1